jgi:adenylate kinase
MSINNETLSSKPMRVILMGPPGAGKGTQGEILASLWGIPRIAPGDIFRAEIKANSDLGIRVKAFSDSGKLVPDEIVIAMMRSRLAQPDTNLGWILDGFPRTLIQAESLDTLLQQMTQMYDYVINLEVPDRILIDRLLVRAQSDGRVDDSEDVIKNRLQEYYAKTKPLLDFYGQKVIVINGTSTLNEVTKDIQLKLGLI